MGATASLRDLGQSLWLDNITRDLLNNGTLKHYINDLSITGVTSNPTIFDHAIKSSTAYDAAILEWAKKGKTGEDLFFELAIDDIQKTADLLNETHTATNGVDGWCPLRFRPRSLMRRKERSLRRHSSRGGSTTECLHQDSGHSGRAPGGRRGDLFRSRYQHHAPLLAGAVRRRCDRLS